MNRDSSCACRAHDATTRARTRARARVGQCVLAAQRQRAGDSAVQPNVYPLIMFLSHAQPNGAIQEIALFRRRGRGEGCGQTTELALAGLAVNGEGASAVCAQVATAIRATARASTACAREAFVAEARAAIFG